MSFILVEALFLVFCRSTFGVNIHVQANRTLSLSFSPPKELQVIEEITNNVDETIVFITLDRVLQPHIQRRAIYVIDVLRLTRNKINAVKNIHTNNELVYLIIIPVAMENEEELINIIRTEDKLNQIILVSRKWINIQTKYNNTRLYNIHFLIPRNGVYYQIGVCMFCNGGKNAIDVENIWSSRGFKHRFRLKNSFRGKFFNTSINVSTNGRHKRKAEFNRKICTAISNHLVVRFNFIGPTDGIPSCLSISKNKTIGMINDLLSGKSEIISCGCFGNLRAYKYADFSSIVEYYQDVILNAKPSRGLVWYSMFKSFDLITWILIILSIPVCGAALYVMSKVRFGRIKEITFRNSIWAMVTMICWDANNAIFKLKHLRQRFVIGSYAVMAFLIISAYQGTVVSFLTVPQFMYPPIDTKEQFITSERRWLTKGHSHEWFWQDVIFKGTDLIKSKKECFTYERVKGSHFYALNKLLSGPDQYVYFHDFQVLKTEIKRNYVDVNGKHPFYFGKETDIAGGYLYMLLKKSCYFKAALDSALGALRAAGIPNHLRRQEEFRNELFGRKKALEFGRKSISSERPSGIPLKLLRVPCGLISIGYILAALVLFFEILHRKRHPKIIS